MSDTLEPGGHGEGKHGLARQLMEASMKAQQDGNPEEAERLMEEAIRTDPQAVEDALLESRDGPGAHD